MKPFVFAALSIALFAGCASHGNAPLVPAANPDSSFARTMTFPQNTFSQDPSTAAAPPGSLRFVVALPLRNEAELDRVIAAISDPDSPQYRNFLTPEQFTARYAPTAASLDTVAANLQQAGFTVSLTDQAVSAYGPQAKVERYFRTSFGRTSEGVFAPRAAVSYPRALTALHASVLGLSGIPLMQRFSQMGKPFAVQPNFDMRPDNYQSPLGPYLPVDLKQAYGMPSIQDATGKGVTIGIIMDSAVSAKDMKVFFKAFRSAEPKITTVKIDGGGPFPGDGTGEATLDVQQSGGVAPGAHIILYDIAQLSNQDIYNGYAAAVKGGAKIVNSSFGGCEFAFKGTEGKKALMTFDALFKQGISEGVTWVASSGDHGADQCGNALNGRGVSWPADSIYVLAVGGTNLVSKFQKGSNDSTYVRESEMHDTKPNNGGNYWGSGGGFSELYARPSWQNGFVSGKGRGVPDVSLHMGGLGFSSGATSGSGCEAQKCSKDDSSDILYELGNAGPVIGTSASSPDMAGLLALGSDIAGKPLGDVHASLYAAAKHKGLFRTGIPANNGLPGTKGLWDPVLGLGTPFAAYKLVGGHHPAGVPGSSSNP